MSHPPVSIQSIETALNDLDRQQHISDYVSRTVSQHTSNTSTSNYPDRQQPISTTNETGSNTKLSSQLPPKPYNTIIYGFTFVSVSINIWLSIVYVQCNTNNTNHILTHSPTHRPTYNPTYNPTFEPTHNPTGNPTFYPTQFPTANPTFYPTQFPTANPTFYPTQFPTGNPTFYPTQFPTGNPTFYPTQFPTGNPTSND